MKFATRPCYMVTDNIISLVKTKDIKFEYFSGFAKQQRQKSALSLKMAIKTQLNVNSLEISRASDEPLGQRLSAFNLELCMDGVVSSVERFFQGSKIFENGGPFIEIIYDKNIHPKRYERLKDSGNFIGFKLFDEVYETEPLTYFYDWLYLSALRQNEDLASKVLEYDCFADIEFNPKKSLSSQAKTVALFVAMNKAGVLDNAMKDRYEFLEFLKTQKAKNSLF